MIHAYFCIYYYLIHFLHAAVTKIHILFKLTSQLERGDPARSLLSFTTLLIKKLSECHIIATAQSKMPQKGKKTKLLILCHDNPERPCDHHLSEQFLRMGYSNGYKDMQSACIICVSKPHIRWQQCQIALCINSTAHYDGCLMIFYKVP